MGKLIDPHLCMVEARWRNKIEDKMVAIFKEFNRVLDITENEQKIITLFSIKTEIYGYGKI